MSAPPGFGTEIHRQRTEIDLNQLSKLGAFQATLNEVAAWFDVSTTTIDERLAENKLYEYEGKQLTFREIFENGKLKGKANLRRLQMIHPAHTTMNTTATMRTMLFSWVMVLLHADALRLREEGIVQRG